MGCGGSKPSLELQRGDRKFTLTKKQRDVLERWGLGALARRRFKKLAQLEVFTGLKKPMYVNGKLVQTKEVLIDEEDLRWYTSYDGAGKGLWWNTFETRLFDDKLYIGQFKSTKKRVNDHIEGLGTLRFKDGSKY